MQSLANARKSPQLPDIDRKAKKNDFSPRPANAGSRACGARRSGGEQIVWMTATTDRASAIFLWSVPLPVSSVTKVRSGSGQGGTCQTVCRCAAMTVVVTSCGFFRDAAAGVGSMLRDKMSSPDRCRGFFQMCVLAARAITRPFQWKEFILQGWFLFRVTFVPTIATAIPNTILIIFTLNILLVEFGAADISGSALRSAR